MLNIYSATKPPADLKNNLKTLKSSLNNLKGKLSLLKDKLRALGAELSKPIAATGTSGSWHPLENKAFGNNIGIKIFHEKDPIKRARIIAIEFYTWEHIKNIYQIVFSKADKPEEWSKFPCSEFFYSSEQFGLYHETKSKEDVGLETSKLMIKIENELSKRKIAYENRAYLIMDDFSSDYTLRKKVSSDGWRNDLKEFILINMNKYLPEYAQDQYLEKLVLKIGYTLLLFYYMGVTVEDCDMFIIFNPEFNKSVVPQAFTNKTANVDDYVKATRIKLVDFGESRIFYRKFNETIMPVDDNWYKNPPDDDCVKIVIKNKNQALSLMSKDFGGSVLTDNVATYLGDMPDKIQSSFKLLKEFPEKKQDIKNKFEAFKKKFGNLKYDDLISKVLS
jgi:hypothetical protein